MQRNRALVLPVIRFWLRPAWIAATWVAMPEQTIPEAGRAKRVPESIVLCVKGGRGKGDEGMQGRL